MGAKIASHFKLSHSASHANGTRWGDDKMRGDSNTSGLNSGNASWTSEFEGKSRSYPMTIEIGDDDKSGCINKTCRCSLSRRVKHENYCNSTYVMERSPKNGNASGVTENDHEHISASDVVILDDDTDDSAASIYDIISDSDEEETSISSRSNSHFQISDSEADSNNISIESNASFTENSQRTSEFGSSGEGSGDRVSIFDDDVGRPSSIRSNERLQSQDSNSSDCEIVSGNDDEMRKIWEEAAYRKNILRKQKQRRDGIHYGASTSKSGLDSYKEACQKELRHSGSDGIANRDPIVNSSNDIHGIAKNEGGEKGSNKTKRCHFRENTSYMVQTFHGSTSKEEIYDRESLKETAEFQQAAKEEWEKRQQEVERQRGEVECLKRRKRAEAERNTDLERRQKQRIEEIRQTLKKEEETMSLKEKFQSQIRQNLQKIASSCNDLPTLLRHLGIQVEGGSFPSQKQVNVAYKQALFQFHPDRASSAKGTLWDQVEAEEKFKLISRSKQLLSTSSITCSSGR